MTNVPVGLMCDFVLLSSMSVDSLMTSLVVRVGQNRVGTFWLLLRDLPPPHRLEQHRRARHVDIAIGGQVGQIHPEADQRRLMADRVHAI